MNKKQQFIKSQIWSLSVAAAFQRGNVYKKDSAPTDKKKSEFKSEMKKIIDSQIERLETVKSDEYIEWLEKLQKQINAMIKEKGFSSGVQHFRFGTLQKLVNLYLKYQWCLGWQPEPHHCPFDGVVLEKLNVSGKWTKSDSAVEYRDWVDEAQEKSKEGSIAQWELKVWNEWLEGESG